MQKLKDKHEFKLINTQFTFQLYNLRFHIKKMGCSHPQAKLKQNTLLGGYNSIEYGDA